MKTEFHYIIPLTLSDNQWCNDCPLRQNSFATWCGKTNTHLWRDVVGNIPRPKDCPLILIAHEVTITKPKPKMVSAVQVLNPVNPDADGYYVNVNGDAFPVEDTCHD